MEDELLDAAAKRYRVNVDRIAESVAVEFAAIEKKREERKTATAASTKKGTARKNSKPKN